MRRIAFIGIKHADNEVLHDALRRNLGEDSEIKVFGSDTAAVAIAPFLVSKNKETGSLDGTGSVAFISSDADENVVKRIGKLASVGVVVRTGWSDFDTEADEEAIGQWLSTGSWPEPEPETTVEEDDDADVNDLLASLLDDGEDEADEPAPAPAPFRSNRYDSISVNEAPVAPAKTEDKPAPEQVERVVEAPVVEQHKQEETSSFADDDDDMPLPSFNAAPPVDEPVPAPAPAPQSFEPQIDAEDDAPLPAFNPEPVAEATLTPAAPVAQDELADDDVDLPDWLGSDPTPTTAQSPQPASAPVEEPAFSSRRARRSLERAQEPEFEEAEVPEPAPSPQPAAPQFNAVDEDEDAPLPAFNPSFFDEEPVAPAPVQEPTPVRQETQFESTDDDVDLPEFDFSGFSSEPAPDVEEQSARPVAQSEPQEYAAPSWEAPKQESSVLEEDNGDDLPSFPPLQFEREEESQQATPEFSDADADNEGDDLPSFQPLQREREEERTQQATPTFEEADDDGDDLPSFSPELAPPVIDEEPVAPTRRAAQSPVESGDDLPDFIARDSAPAASQKQVEEDEDGDEFAFAPKTHTPSYAAPPEKLPDWGVPVQRPESVQKRIQEEAAARAERERAEREAQERAEQEREAQEERERAARAERAERARAEREEREEQERDARAEQERAARIREAKRSVPVPTERVAPDSVRYENDNPYEVAERQRARLLEDEGYQQPQIETDVQDRELKPAPGVLRDEAPRVVNKRPAAPIIELDDDVLPPAKQEEDILDSFDPDAMPPYMEKLEPEKRRTQSTMETIRREYDTEGIFKVTAGKKATSYYVTGSHGGAGKTTSTWMMANTAAAALKQDPERPVFLIEGDYENSKLAQRLNLPPEKNSGKLAELFRKLSADRSLITKQRVDIYKLTEKLIKESIHVNDHGVHIIAAPYDLTKRDGKYLRMAIQKSVEYAERQGGLVFIDADTLSNDDVLDRTLAAKSTHIVLVSFGDQDHVDDTHRAIHTLTTPSIKSVSHNQSTNGMGVPKDRIKLFFNKTGSDRYEDLQRIMLPYQVEGHLPTIQGLNEGGWIGNLTGGDFLSAVTSYAVFLNRISPMPELLPYQQRKPQKSTQRGGFMRMFTRR